MEDSLIKKHIIRWTLIGLLIRFLIMPFSFHGHDLFFIYYCPFKFLTSGAWDPYIFIKNNFSHAMHNIYFPPGVFLIISGFLAIFKIFLPRLAEFFSLFELWNFQCQGNSMHYANIFLNCQLFRTLFVFKLPYLLFDFGIGWFLFKILRDKSNTAVFAYKLWMLNPLVLHSCYALGQLDIIPTFFVMAAIYAMYIKRNFWAMFLLSLGVVVKTLPVLLLPVAILLSADTFKERLKLSLIALFSIGAMFLPFYLSSGNMLFEAIFFSPGEGALPRQNFFVFFYLTLLVLLFFSKAASRVKIDSQISVFALVFISFFALYVVTIRYFILITPFLIYLAIIKPRFWIYNIAFTVILFELRACGNTLQWGMFSALHPEFFSGLPIGDSFLNLITDVTEVHRWAYRLFVFFSAVMALDIILSYKQVFFSLGKHNVKIS